MSENRIPTHLDAIVTPELIIEPEIGVHKKTYETTIIVKVIDRKRRVIIDVQVFPDQDSYANFVDSLLSE